MLSKNKNSSALIVFAKYPKLGEVKTRLAATLGKLKAYDLYKALAKNTFQLVNSLRSKYDIFLFYSNEKDETKVREWVGCEFKFFPQTGNDLGERMSNAFQYIFDSGYLNAVIIGTDVPDHSASNLSRAKDALLKYDTVIGPCGDGGYYLLGVNSYYPILFQSINWSTSEVAEKTVQKIKSMNKSLFILDDLIDIDEDEDLQSWLSAEGGNMKLKEYVKSMI